VSQVLVVEDNRDIAHLVRMHLGDIGIDVDHACDGVVGLREARSKDYDLIILDLMLPGLEGREVCRQLRAKNILTPILMLTAKSTEIDRVRGLEIGADDYMTKPFSILELVARVKAILRRAEQYQNDSPANSAHRFPSLELEINTATHQVFVKGQTVELTAKEFDLLWHLARYPGQVFSRAQLLDSIWGYGHEGYEHTVNSHINRLRTKIESNPAKPEIVRTVWGVGYKFADGGRTVTH
jgi:DNA-binding response OmpR family regulator